MCLGVPGRVVGTTQVDGMRMATVEFGGVRQQVCLECTPEADVGDYVLVHVGFALSVLDEQLAQETLRELRSLGIGAQGEELRE